MSNELSKFSFEITSMKEAMDYAKLIADSDLAPKDYKGKAGNVLVAIQYGIEVGLKPLQAIQNIAVINGRPSIWGDSMIALVQGNPLCEYIIEHYKPEEGRAYFITKRKGDPNEHISTFSIDDAKKAGLWGKPGPWTNYPERMLKMRARAFGLRDKYSDVLKGMAMAEEVMDYEVKDVTPANNETKNRILSLINSEPKKVEEQSKAEPAIPELPSKENDKIEKLIKMLSRFEELGISKDKIISYYGKFFSEELIDHMDDMANIGLQIKANKITAEQAFNKETK